MLPVAELISHATEDAEAMSYLTWGLVVFVSAIALGVLALFAAEALKNWIRDKGLIHACKWFASIILPYIWVGISLLIWGSDSKDWPISTKITVAALFCVLCIPQGILFYKGFKEDRRKNKEVLNTPESNGA